MTIPESLQKNHLTAPFQEHCKSTIPRELQEHHSKSKSTPRALHRHYSKSTPKALSEHLSKSTIPRAFNTIHSKAFKKLYSYMALVRFVVISLCCFLVAVGSGFVIFGTGCDRVRFSVVVGTIFRSPPPPSPSSPSPALPPTLPRYVAGTQPRPLLRLRL